MAKKRRGAAKAARAKAALRRSALAHKRRVAAANAKGKRTRARLRAKGRRARLKLARGRATAQARAYRIGKKARIYGAKRSKPGEPPYKQTGHLRKSVAWEVNGLTGRIGSNLAKARWLELGTRRMAARPWLRRALNESKADIARLLGIV